MIPNCRCDASSWNDLTRATGTGTLSSVFTVRAGRVGGCPTQARRLVELDLKELGLEAGFAASKRDCSTPLVTSSRRTHRVPTPVMSPPPSPDHREGQRKIGPATISHET